MRTVILTSGPIGGGKSTYVEMVQKRHPEISVISRDKIMLALIGSEYVDGYSGYFAYILDYMFEQVKNTLADSLNIKLLLDCWNGFSWERKAIIKRLKECGAERIICWQFITPLSTCIGWFGQKESRKDDYAEESCRHNYKLYHDTTNYISEDGFDAIYQINPLQLTLPGFPLI